MLARTTQRLRSPALSLWSKPLALNRLNAGAATIGAVRGLAARGTMRAVEEVIPTRPKISIAGYLAQRLQEAGLKHYFTVPGDFTLAMLDEFIKNDDLTMISCCNELNAGYAADGYARATGGIGCVMVTYMVGGLSTINAIAGAYSDDLPVICVSGGPNTQDSYERHVVHHTIGEKELYQQSQCFAPIVAGTYVIKHHTDAARMIDQALARAIRERKPVYLEVPVNLATFLIDAPAPVSEMLEFPQPRSDPTSLAAATEAVLRALEASTKPVLLAGSKLRKTRTTDEFRALADSIGCGVATMPDAKGLFPESHDNYMGRYWGSVSDHHCQEVVESSDLILMAGPVLNDYTTTGWTALLPPDKRIIFGANHVEVHCVKYPNVALHDILNELSGSLPFRDGSIKAYKRYSESHVLDEGGDIQMDDELNLRYLKLAVERELTENSTLLVETGDAWFIGQNTRLPDGCKYNVQMQYGSIGWSVGALLGVGLAEGDDRRVLALIGDGSFQLTAQELSTMIRYNVKVTILLLNNDGYTIEVQIHDGAYNDIKMWNYAKLVDTFNNTDGNGLGLKAHTNQQLCDALRQADEHDGVTLIECFLKRDDCTAELLEWGSRVARANGRR